MTQRLVVITGCSRGLGHAMAQQLLEAGHVVLGISRSAMHFSDPQHHFVGVQADLAEPHDCHKAQDWLSQQLRHTSASRVDFIHNAGVLGPMALSHDTALADQAAITHALQINLSAVMALTATFLQHTTAVLDRRIVFISSGAGRAPVPGWAVYGASKAALDYYAQTLQAEAHAHLRCVAIAPGVIDTAMQQHIRQHSNEQFPNVGRFLALHEQGQLQSPQATATQLIDYLERPDFGAQTLDDIRRYS